jgi:hypothetical protein
MNNYLKFFVQAAAVILSVGSGAVSQTNGTLSALDWTNVVITALGALAVLGAGELPAGVWAHTKIYVSAATAGAVVLSSLISAGHIGYGQWLQVAAAVTATFAVAIVPGPTVTVGRVRNKFRG